LTESFGRPREKMDDMTSASRFLRTVAFTTALVIPLAACEGDGGGSAASDGDGPTAAPTGSTLAAEVATTDLYVGAPLDVQIGVFNADDQGVRILTGGAVEVAFSFLGETGASPEPGPTVTAPYLPAPTTAPGGATPALSSPVDARGVYDARDITFDTPGTWQAAVTAEVPEMGTQTVTAAFTVLQKPSLPAPGQPALPTKNLTVRSKGVPKAAIDSMAQDGAPIPDPELHRTTVAEAIRTGTPVLLLLGTPLYCQSQFCGPTVSAMQDLASTNEDRAAFIHVEIWKDYDSSVLNEAAADWLYRDGNLTEPWLYLIDGDGSIAERWGPLFDPEEVQDALDEVAT
jgi:hypothetical protein